MIQIQDLKKTYNLKKSNECRALKGVSLEIGTGEMVAIMGKSGAGKSTLMHVLGGIDTFDSGTVEIEGYDLSHMTDRRMAMFRNSVVGIVLQDFGLIDDYSVFENVMIPMDFSSRAKESKKRARAVLKMLNIADLSEKNVTQLSGGQKQRVAIARAMVNSPKILLADEPTGALDTQTSQEIMDVFTEMNKKGITVIIVTHEPSVAAQCQRTIRLSDGMVEAG